MGPLSGKKIVEIAGIGPAPFAAMMLADMGAEVIRVSRPSGSMLSMAQNEKLDFGNRGKRCIALNLKDPHAADVVLRLVESADAIIEGYRPGVMEKLGLGPEVCLARNPRIVFGRMTGWGQDGPLGNAAGRPHDPESQRSTLELALRVLESAPAAHTTVQSPLRWSDDWTWKLDFFNIERVPAEEVARLRADQDRVKAIAKEIREDTTRNGATA